MCYLQYIHVSYLKNERIVLMKVGSFVVAAIGIIAIIVGIVLKVTGQAHGLTVLGVGVVLLILGLVGAFVLKPKAQ